VKIWFLLSLFLVLLFRPVEALAGFLNIVSVDLEPKLVSLGEIVEIDVRMRPQNDLPIEETKLDVISPDGEKTWIFKDISAEFSVQHYTTAKVCGYNQVVARTTRSDGLGDTVYSYFYVDCDRKPKITDIKPRQIPGGIVSIYGENFLSSSPGTPGSEFQVWFSDPETGGVNWLDAYGVKDWEDDQIILALPYNLKQDHTYNVTVVVLGVSSNIYSYTTGKVCSTVFLPLVFH